MPAPAVHKVTSEFLSFMTPASGNLYLIALNYILPRPTLKLWSTATFRICADGGANRLYDEMGTLVPLSKQSGIPADEQSDQHLRHPRTSQEAAAIPALQFSHATDSTRKPAAHTSMSQTPTTARPYMDLTAASLDLMTASLNLKGSDPCNQSGGDGLMHLPQSSSPGQPQTASESTTNQTCHPSLSLPPPSDENTCASDVSEADSSVSGILEVSSTSVLSSGGTAHTVLQNQDPQLQEQQQQLLLPDLIQGDMDSIRADVLDYYTRHGVPHRDLRLDQDSTDLMKCLHYIQDELLRGDPEPTRHTVLVLGAIGGRLDHTLSNLGVLHMFPSLSIVLWGDGNLVRLLPVGRSIITPDQRFEGPKCGLVPISGGITATTTGLKWNCDNLQLKVGGLLSTSNELAGGDVSVETDGPVLWMTEVSDQAVMCAA